MFGLVNFIDDTLNSGINVLDDLFNGETPKTKDVSQLIAMGLSVTAISLLLGVSVEEVEELL